MAENNVPLLKEGYFWFIDDEIIGNKNDIPKFSTNHYFNLTSETETWEQLKPNDCEYDSKYYPRGKVIGDIIYLSDNILNTNEPTQDKFGGYYVMVFLDKCIDDDKYKNIIIDYFNLSYDEVKYIKWMNGMSINDDTYKCHKCREEGETDD